MEWHRGDLHVWYELSNFSSTESTQIPPIPFLTPDEEDYWVEQYNIQKFQYSESVVYLCRLF